MLTDGHYWLFRNGEWEVIKVQNGLIHFTGSLATRLANDEKINAMKIRRIALPPVHRGEPA